MHGWYGCTFRLSMSSRVGSRGSLLGFRTQGSGFRGEVSFKSPCPSSQHVRVPVCIVDLSVCVSFITYPARSTHVTLPSVALSSRLPVFHRTPRRENDEKPLSTSTCFTLGTWNEELLVVFPSIRVMMMSDVLVDLFSHTNTMRP